jgi:hypothetical protein
LFEQAERVAARLGLRRRALFALALAEFVRRDRASSVTERLDAVLGEQVGGLDEVLEAMQRASLPSDEDW